MHHYDSETDLADRLRPIDSTLASKVSEWESKLPTAEYNSRIRSLMEDLEDCRGWEDAEGDRAASLLFQVREYRNQMGLED